MGIEIFLGLFFCGVIYLYTQTKDRWNWSKLRKILLYVTLLTILIGLIIWGGMYLYEKYENRPKVIAELKGVKLGDSLKDVSFKVGEFEDFYSWLVQYNLTALNNTEKNSVEYPIQLKEYQDSLVKQTKYQLNKNESNGQYIKIPIVKIEIKDKKVEYIKSICVEDNLTIKLNGITCKDDGGKISDKFGDEVRVLCSSDKKEPTQRVFDTVKYGVRYYLTKNSVDGFLISEPKTLESYIGEDWVKCD